MTKFDRANLMIDAAMKRAGSVAEVDRALLERRIYDHYVITLAGLGKVRASRADTEEAQAALRTGVRPLIDRRLRAACGRKVESKKLGVTVTKVAANSVKRKGFEKSSLSELVNQTGNEIKKGTGSLSSLRDQVEESIELRKGAMIHFRMSDTPMTETLGAALEAGGFSEDEFYAGIAV